MDTPRREQAAGHAADRGTSASAPLPAPYLVWVGSLWLLQLGDAAMLFAMGWAATSFGGAAAGGVISAIILPRTLLLLLGGVVGDRIGPRSIMLICNSALCAVSLLVAALAWWGGESLPLLYATAVVIGASGAFYVPAAGSYARSLVDVDLIPRAVALRQTGTQLVTIIGGPVGGVLVAFAGLPVTAMLNALSCLVALLVLLRIRPRTEPAAPPADTKLARAAFDGLRLAVQTPDLRVALTLIATATAFIMPLTSLLVPLLARQNAWDASDTGLIIGAQSLGTIIVTLVLTKAGTLSRAGLASTAGLAITGLSALGIAWSPSIAAAMACALVGGLGVGLLIGHLSPVLITATPMSYLARVQSISSLVQSGALLLTTSLLGALASARGPRAAFLCCAVVLALGAALAFSSPAVRSMRGSRS